MPVSDVRAFNSTQRHNAFRAEGRVINANTGVYTCPSNKKAKFKGSMNLDAIGSDATYALAVKTSGGTFRPIGKHVTVNDISVGEGILEAGDKLTMIGDSGSTNGTGDIYAEISELPA